MRNGKPALSPVGSKGWAHCFLLFRPPPPAPRSTGTHAASMPSTPTCVPGMPSQDSQDLAP